MKVFVGIFASLLVRVRSSSFTLRPIVVSVRHSHRRRLGVSNHLSGIIVCIGRSYPSVFAKASTDRSIHPSTLRSFAGHSGRAAKKYFVVGLALLLSSGSFVESQEAVFCKPIVDLFGAKLSVYGGEYASHYQNAPLSGVGEHGCNRIAQGLFHERVEVIAIDEKTGEICVKIPAMQVASEHGLTSGLFWTLKEHLVLLDALETDAAFLPKALTLDDASLLYDDDYVMLHQPFFDKKTGQVYVFGTFFKRNKARDSDRSYGVYIVDPAQRAVVSSKIHKKNCRVCTADLSFAERKALFITYARSFLPNKKGITPYVWGGRSGGKHTADSGFNLVKGTFFTKKIQYYLRNNQPKPCQGFDCSGLVYQLALASGLKYRFKTTKTALFFGTEVSYEKLEPGDLLVWNGHMGIITSIDDLDPDKNMFLEAVGYALGFGQVRESRLKDAFAHIKTYKDIALLKAENKPLLRYNKAGKIDETIPTFKFIRVT